MASAGGDDPNVGDYEPLATLIRQVMDAEGLRVSDVAHATGESRQYISQVINRRKPYSARYLPSVDKQLALARLRGISVEDVADALAESTGAPRPRATRRPVQKMSAKRQNLHRRIDKLPEEELDRALQLLDTIPIDRSKR